MYYKDLDFYQNEVKSPIERVRHVGWLDKNESYKKGSISQDRLNKLKSIFLGGRGFSSEVRPLRGPAHKCNLCGEVISISSGDNKRELGCSELLVPADGVDYMSPSLIIHYIEEHNYLPPEEYLAAVDQLNLMENFCADEYFLDLEIGNNVARKLDNDKNETSSGNDSIISHFITYCHSKFNEDVVGPLAKSLLQSGQQLEAEALIYTFKKKGESKIWRTLKTNDFVEGSEGCLWAGSQIWVGQSLPKKAKPADWWFDPLEIMFYVRIDRKPLDEFDKVHPGWCALTPCRVWQYRACIQLAQFEPDLHPQSMLQVKDLFQDRHAGKNYSEYITDIYAEEALLYSRFWGRDNDLVSFGPICRSLIPEQALSLFSHHLLLIGGYPGREELSGLIDSHLLFERPFDSWPHHFKMLEDFTTLHAIGEWDKHPKGAFQCYIEDQFGGLQYSRNLPRKMNYGTFHNEIFNLSPNSK